MQGMILNSDPIKICFIAPKAYPLFNPDVKAVFGGAEVDLYLLACELAKDGSFEVSFIVADYGQADIETIENVTVIKSLSFTKNPLIGAIKIWQAMKKADAGMYMIKTVSVGMFLTAFFCRLNSKLFLYRTSNSRHCDGTHFKKYSLRKKLYIWALKTAGLITVQSFSDRDDLGKVFGVTPVAIPNGHQMPSINEKSAEKILWVGRSDYLKQPELFIDLAEKNPSQNFVMICPRASGDEKYEKLVAKAGNVNNLEFIERTDFDKITDYYRVAKIFVNTSLTEGFPNTFIEAGKCEVPILSLNVNPDNFLEKYKCGICCGDDIELLNEKLSFLLDGNRYVELGKNARKYVEEKHDITKIITQYKELFRVLLARSKT